MTTMVLQDERPGTDPAPVVTAVDVVRPVDIAVGHLTAVMGPSGSGKSALTHSKEA